jgi:hydrogenase assembly chaperone HypC/HupF
MCLAIPAKVVGVEKDVVEVDHGGRRKKVNSKLVKPKRGDYVLVQFGFVTEILDKEVAEKSLKSWRELNGKI